MRLHGKKLDGVWSLIPAKLSGDEKNWLILRKRDEDGAAASPAKRARRYRPMLATLEKTVPTGEDWTYEVKWDGYRAVAYVARRRGRALSRNDNDLTARFPDVAKAIGKALQDAERGARRRGLRARRGRPRDVLRDAAGQAGHALPLRRLRPARGRRRARRRLAVHRAAQAAPGAARQAEPRRAVLGGLRRRRGALRGREAAALRGDHGEAPAVALPARAPHARLAEDQGERTARSS